MHTKHTQKHGFTIVELLVTIVVIGILAAITIVSYTGISQRSRDSRRDSDVTQVKLALEKYHADKGGYPSCGDDTADDSACLLSTIAPTLSPYISSFPHDPLFKQNASKDYRYVRGSVDPSDTSAVDSYGILV